MDLGRKVATTKEFLNNVRTIDFDSNIDQYHYELCLQKDKISIQTAPNQFCYFFDFYKMQIDIPENNNLKEILGYDLRAYAEVSLLYDIIHPADRLQIYNATLLSLKISYENGPLITPLKDVFSMDYRIRKKNGEYIRVLRNTVLATQDKEGNMVHSFALFTDITNIKKSKRINFDFHGYLKNTGFSNERLVIKNDIFSCGEMRILNLLMEGKSSKEIAQKLCISNHTVDTHRRKMLKKAYVHNSAELVMFAKEHSIA